MSEKHFFFVCGPHCTGKTTILKNLKARKIIDFNGSEIGKDLYYSRKFQVDGQLDDFEQEVAKLEIARDKTLYSDHDMNIAVSETWHPGNLAYAKVRNPHCVKGLIEYVKRSPFISSARGIWLRISREIIAARTKTFADDPAWAADFYTRIDSEIESCLNALDLYERTTILNAEISLQDVEDQIAAIISEQAGVQ